MKRKVGTLVYSSLAQNYADVYILYVCSIEAVFTIYFLLSYLIVTPYSSDSVARIPCCGAETPEKKNRVVLAIRDHLLASAQFFDWPHVP